MFVDHIDNIAGVKIESAEAKGITKQVPIGPEQGWEDHVMRVFTVEPGGHTPHHSHAWPHINYVLAGAGELSHSGSSSTVQAGSVAYIPGGTEHQFRNTGSEPLKFICIVPREGEK
jgi:quercetin dioxygenase-like cupin family protein